MARLHSAWHALALIALFAAADGARQLPAAAPAPSPGGGVDAASQGAAPAQAAAAPVAAPAAADGQSTLQAEAAAFVNATELFLAGVVKRVPWSIQSPSGPRTGQFLLSDYVSPRFADTNGFWMGLPQAVMHAAVKGTRAPPRTWVLQLSRPRFNATADTLAFTVQVLRPGSAPKYPGGAAAYALANADGSLAAEAQVGEVLGDVVIFVDDSMGAGSASGPGGGAQLGAGGEAEAVRAGGTRLTSVSLTGLYQPGNVNALPGGSSGTLAQPTAVSTAATTIGSGQGLLQPQDNSSSPALINGGSALVNSVSAYGRTSFCPNLGWIYAADPYRCTQVVG